MILKICLLLLFFAITIGVGFYCRKQATDIHGFVLGGHAAGAWLTAFAYGTSYFSAVIFVGYAGQFGWRFGIASTWIGLGNAFIGSLLAWVILGRRTRLMTQHLKSSTMPEFFGARFNSKSLKIGASIIIFIFLIPYTASLYNGLSRMFAMAFDVPYEACIIVMALLTAVYVIAGGYMATAINDFIQGIIMLIGIVAIIASTLRINGGFVGSLDALARVSDTTVSDTPGIFASFFGPDPFSLLAVVILTSLGTWGLPQMVQKFYAIKNEHDISKGTLISTLFAVVVAGGCYFLGGFGRLFPVDIAKEGYDAIIPGMMSNLSDFLLAVLIILILSASMSTLSSLVLASSSTLTLDLIKDNIVKNMPEKLQVRILKILVVVFVVISAVIAIFQYNTNTNFIAQLMGVSWGALAGAFLAPFLFSLYSTRITKAACWTSFIFGVGIMTLNLICRNIFPAVIQSPINCGAFAMIVGIVIVPIVSLFTKKPDKDLVDHAFDCYEKKVLVPAKETLGDD